MRYNTFNQIHKGLRFLMFDTAIRVQQNNFMNEAETLPVIQQLEEMLALFDSHAHNEDTYVLTPVMLHAPEVVAAFESEHQEDHKLATQLQQAVYCWEEAQSADKKLEAGKNILYSLNDFVAFNLKHMNKEEDILNKILWLHFTDADIKLFEQAIIRNTPPEKIARYALWMVRALNEAEIIRWVSEVKQHAAAPVYNMLAALIQQEHPQRCETLLAVHEYAL